jgi:hypothetical protein
MTSADDACSGYGRRGFLTLSIASGASASLFPSCNSAARNDPKSEPSHIYHFKGRIAWCANFAGMGNDNKGNRIAVGTTTTDYGFMQGEYFAGRNADQLAQAGHRARTTLPCIIGFVVGCARRGRLGR